MQERGGYGQFCPVAMASEIICTRWTMLIVRELLCGSTRFNDLRRGLPRMSPALLSKRLKELEESGVIVAARGPSGGNEYRLSPSGEDLRAVVMGVGLWGHRWVESKVSLKNLDPTLLMWDIHRNVKSDAFPPRRCTVQFLYPELPREKRSYWLVIDSGRVDLCYVDPGFEIDLLVTSPLRTMTAIWMGMASLRNELSAGRVSVDGDRKLAAGMEKWLGFSGFAGEQRNVG